MQNDMRVSIRETVAKLIGAVTAEFGPDSATVVECVPQGRSIFSTCRDDELAIHLSTLRAAVVTARAADLAPAIVTLSNGLKTQWTQRIRL